MVIWITGKSKAGKTTLSKSLKNKLYNFGYKPFLIDGDESRKVSNNQDFTDEGRLNNIFLAARLGEMVQKQGFDPIISLVSPKKEWRQSARKIFTESVLVYVIGGILWENTIFEAPDPDEENLVIYDWKRHHTVYSIPNPVLRDITLQLFED